MLFVFIPGAISQFLSEHGLMFVMLLGACRGRNLQASSLPWANPCGTESEETVNLKELYSEEQLRANAALNRELLTNTVSDILRRCERHMANLVLIY